MLHKPQFKYGFQVEKVEPDKVFLLSEQDAFLLKGRLYLQIAPLLDGQRTADEIVKHLQCQVSAAEVYYALMLMEKKGYIVEADDSLPENVAAFWETLNLEPKEAISHLQTKKVAVKTCGKEPLVSQLTAQLTATLESLHIQVGETGDLEVVLTDDYLHDSLDTYNQQALQSQQPWMLVKPMGRMFWLGPIFHPGQTGCWQCLAQRLRANRPVQVFIEECKGNPLNFSTSLAVLPTTLQTSLGMTATAIARWLAQDRQHPLLGKLVTLDHRCLETQSHTLVKRPQCPCCGNLTFHPQQDPVPINLQSCKKIFTSDGGHRSCSPEATFQRYQHHISPILGVVRELRRVSPPDNLWNHTYGVGHHFSTFDKNLDSLRAELGFRSGGKGRTDSQAKVSGLCEAIERYSGFFEGYEIRRTGSYKSMGEQAIHPNACMLFSQEQYRTREDWNAQCLSSHKVPDPFEPELEIEWTPVWSLTQQTFKYLPTAYCYYGYQGNHPPFCYGDSNGNAAGNTLEEAILQGFMELVERDAVAIWWYNRLLRPGVNLASFQDRYFAGIQEYYATIGRELWVLDITSNLGISVFAALSRRFDRPTEEIIYGFGAHFDPKIAIMRAITELNQSLPLVFSEVAAESLQDHSPNPQYRNWWKTATLENQPYLAADASVPAKVYGDYPQYWHDDLRDDILTCVEITQRLGLEMLVLDQTRPDIGLKVVKEIVPGLRHFRKRAAPGRLYEVPVQLGWLPEPTPEHQLNPFPLLV